MIPYRQGWKEWCGSLPRRSESCRCSGSAPRSAKWQAGRDRRAAAPNAREEHAVYSWAQLVFTGVIDHALDIDDVFLVTRIDQQFCPAARARQIDIDGLLDAAGRTRHHHDLVRQKHRLIDRMGDEQHRLAVALPDIEQVVLQPR